MGFNRPGYFNIGLALRNRRGETVFAKTRAAAKTLEPANNIF
jgi:hypothetical protein